MTGTIFRLSAHGDTPVAAWDTEVVGAVAEAERIIDEARAQGETVVALHGDSPAERITRFDPQTHTEVAIIPRMAGG